MALLSPMKVRKQFDEKIFVAFYAALKDGMKDEAAMHTAGLLPTEYLDFQMQIDHEKYAWAKAESKMPKEEVKKRMNNIMASANDPENPMPAGLALDILERVEPDEWSKKQTITVKPPDPKLPEDEVKRLHSVFGLPVIETTAEVKEPIE